jgi:DNA polymerase-4
MGIRTIGQIAALPEKALSDRFGEMGRHIWQLAHGQDDRTVVADREAKSVSTETTFAHDIGDRAILRVWLLDLVDHLASRLRHEGIWARTIDVKMRSSDFRTVTRSTTLPEATNLTNAIWKAATDLFERSLTSELLPVRLLGVPHSAMPEITAMGTGGASFFIVITLRNKGGRRTRTRQY